MKATGIVRRIDDLGRVVIPKEIRRTMRIREGDPLEIFTNSNGEVIFKKYSPIGELEPYTKQYAEVLARACDLPAIICDTDHVIAVSGMPKKELMEKKISPDIEHLMLKRELYSWQNIGEKMELIKDSEHGVAALMPIIGSGDVMGAVVLLSVGNGAPLSETQIKILQVAAGFLGKQMEE
ncbi:MAG: stage V sporulation T C-terminal domain-containing protein [Clostridia bacterium]